MPFSAAGVYTPPTGAENAQAGQVIQSAIWNAIFTDIADNGLTKCFTRAGNDNAEATIVSAATVDLSTATSLRVQITGATGPITSFGAGVNLIKIIRFASNPKLTNSSALALPGGQNIQAFAGDEALVTSDASGNWRTVHWFSADALPVVRQQAFRNVLWMNGSFDIWQRGAGASASISVAATTTAYTSDRWYITTAANQASTIAATTALGTNSILAAKVQRNNAQTGTGAMIFGYPLDTDEVIRCRGKSMTLSLLAKAGANWSPASGTLTVNVYFGTGAVAKRGGGFTNETNPVTGTAALTTTATTFIFQTSAAVSATATQGEVQFTWTPVGTAGADDSFTIDDVAFEPATNAPAYEPIPFPTALEGCKRHYRKTFPYSVAPAQTGGLPGVAALIANAASAQGIWWQHIPNPLRATATNTTFNPSGASANAQNLTTAASLATSLDSIGMNSPEGILIYVSVNSASIAAGNAIAVHIQADAGI